MTEPIRFETAAELRAWLAEHAADEPEVWVALRGVAPGRTGLRFGDAAEAAAEAGWVDSGRRTVDATTFAVRFAPGRVERGGAPAALQRRAWEDQAEPVLGEEFETEFRMHDEAWKFFEAQRPAYRRAAVWWVTSGKQPETRRRRLDALIEGSAKGERLPQLVRNL